MAANRSRQHVPVIWIGELQTGNQILNSAKGTARTAKESRNWLAPYSVLRVFLNL